ncbi:MAG: HlyD family type I secretion periplasmic adaptor subunit [Betaproteobacteria bacterium]|nr:HlyD family type I secretion periplasmic adaptor subunit [Betaproteobacteria bacterium]
MISIRHRIAGPEAGLLDFAPAILKAQHQPPSPFPRFVLYTLLALVGVLLIWAVAGRLDIVAVAQGKLVPQSFLKVVQPSEAGIVKQILVKEGDEVAAGQVLMRMDTSLSEADGRSLLNEVRLKRLQVRRIDAELGNTAMARKADDVPALFAQVEAQHRARRQAYQDALEAERAVLAKTQQDLKGAAEIEAKLKRTAPIYQEQERAWDQLAKEGFAGKLLVLDRQRYRIENEQDLRAQQFTIASLRATITQSEKRISQITSNYRQQLQNERVETGAQLHKLEQDSDKQQHRSALLELRAPQAGIVKDLATHTQGTVVAPGTVLLTLVPHNEPLLAEIWINNADSGFVEVDQKVKIKLEAYPFQKYGMLDGVVRHVTYDAADKTTETNGDRKSETGNALNYRALVVLNASQLEAQGLRYKLIPGMQVAAEINLGNRSVIEYLLSPIQKTAHEAGRER